MSKCHFIRCGSSNIKLPENLTLAQCENLMITLNTMSAYKMGINSIEEYFDAVANGEIKHKWCYSEKSEKLRCAPHLPLSDDVVSIIENGNSISQKFKE